MPSLRSLASELGVARGTVGAAYDRLIGEGYLVARGASGTFVSQHLNASVAATAPGRRQDPMLIGRSANAVAPPLALALGLPALDAFPRKLWARLLAREARHFNSLARPVPAGHMPLRSAIATYLGVSRGVACHAGQVFIVPGYTAALDLVAQTLLARGDSVWVESPGYPPTQRLLSDFGAKVVAVPVDDAGLVVADGIRQAPDARLAVVTPSHQSPTGVSLSLARRMELLAWAAGSLDAWVLEDDYDGEYRYRGHPLPALKSLDRAERVIYTGTFSKVLFPGLRLGYLVVPDTEIPRFEDAALRSPSLGCPELLQSIVAAFMEQGHFGRHVKNMRALYARRRELLARALERLPNLSLRVDLQAGGMHLLVHLDASADDAALARTAQAAGFGIHPLSAWGRSQHGPALLMGFTNVATPQQAKSIVSRLAAAWRAEGLID